MAEQQVVFMNPQSENLDHLYDLIKRITLQLSENKEKRAQLLRNVDVLANELNNTSRKEASDDVNIPVFTDFLERRNYEVLENLGNEPTQLNVLRKQNGLLKEMLKDKSVVNNETLCLLKVHEEYLSDAVTLLRQDVLSYRQLLVQRYRSLYQDGLIALENQEFEEYIKNIEGIQELMDLSEVLRAFLRIDE